ncbi:MAG: hypothetical protein CVV22_05295 [Ignavibacteriae bacterium HGW-Ignavibacteriae-1]|jgi:hypothetical protein|nr:MAG: hypothetical protein CVV22_05295 [Ignavibacteriae bacterium HGW-Ignavibacteriae-1]
MKIFTFILVFLVISINAYAQRAECDLDLNCVGRAITFSQSSGKQAHYVDVENTPSQEQITDKMTIEMWIKPERQAGKVQYIAGFWGPANDVNDVWVMYINPNDELVFEINSPTTNLLSTDNTIAKANVATMYDTWYHVAGVFDGTTQTIKLYIDGNLRNFARNNSYPATRLRIAQNPELTMKIGNTNAYSNDENLNRTFLGQIDEVRIWSRTFTDAEIFCNRNRSLNWNIPDLILHYRCNEEVGKFILCDASNNGNTGYGRSGAVIQNSNRPIERTIFTESLDRPVPIIDTLDCKSPRTYRFAVWDTSSCGKSVIIDLVNTDFAADFKIQPNRINNMVKDSMYYFTVTVNADFQGTILPQLRIYALDRCRFINRFNLNLTRVTQLQYSNLRMNFDSLKANCIEKPHIDSVLTIINQTAKTGTPQTITINSISNVLTNLFVVNHLPLPYQLAPGDTFRINIRFVSGKFTSDNFDTLRINSTDICDPTKAIPFYGKVKEVIRIAKGASEIRLDSINFGTSCLDFPSDAPQYNWMNLLDENIDVIDIEYPRDVQGNQRLFPLQLDPVTGYLPNYFRFIPTQPGLMQDSIIIVVKSGDCTIRRPIYVRGYGLFADIQFEIENLDFGDVIVGQESLIDVPVKNNSPENLSVSFYLKKSDVFFISGQQTLSIPAGATRNITVGFRPTSATDYTDELCFFENRCYVSGCIKVKGRGILERFAFDPEVLKIENVIACNSKDGEIKIINRTSTTQNLRNIIFNNPNGRFTISDPTPLPQQLDLAAGSSYTFSIRYTPNDLVNDRSDIAFIEYETSDGEKWIMQIRGTSLTPKLSVESPVIYGKIEVGETKDRKIVIENVSPFPVTIETINAPIGFLILDNPARFTNITLNSRDTIQITVQFNPGESRFYQGDLEIKISQPCESFKAVKLEGEAEIIALEVPLTVLSFGFVLPCDCIEREIKMINRSKVFDMEIDSIYLSDVGLSNPNASYFSWTSDYYQTNGNQMPFSIPPGQTDILKINYCPRDIQNIDSLTHNINIIIESKGTSWSSDFRVYLTGIQAMLFQSNRDSVIFTPTRVDTDANPQFVELKFPNYLLNPYRDIVLIDTIKFVPDERVFYAFDSLKYDLGLASYPSIIDTGKVTTIQFGFKPRAVRDYEAKAEITLRKIRPNGECVFMDTTIYLSGSGFAPAFGLSFHFGSNFSKQDTFRVITCEEITIPIYSSRDFPAEIVDINFQLDYDTTKLEYIGHASQYLSSPCKGYAPLITHNQNEFGSNLLLKNFCFVDSIRPVAELRFRPKQNTRDTMLIRLDTMNFDTEEVILYHIIAALDEAVIIIQQPELEILPNDIFLTMDYDSVRVLDCRDLTFSVRNIGDVPISGFDILQLQSYYEVVSYIPDKNDMIDVGDSVTVTIRFCPRNTGEYGSMFNFISSLPCTINDSAMVTGIGFAPIFNPIYYINDAYISPDTIYSKLGDTISIPIYLDKNFADTIYGNVHIIKDLDFAVNMTYNPRSMKYLSTDYTISGLDDIEYRHGDLNYVFAGVDNLSRGKIAESRFLVTVPDFTFAGINLNSSGYTTDSIMFFDIVPLESFFFISTSDSCGIDSLIYGQLPLPDAVFPNPAKDFIYIPDYIGEYEIFDLLGRKIISGFTKGEAINIHQINQGFYIIRYDGKTEKLIVN